MFHFYGSYTGESGSAWLEIAATIFGVLVAAGISLWIFHKEREKERRKEKERLDEIEEYVKISIPLLCQRINSQLKNLKKVEAILNVRRVPDNFNYEHTASLHGRSLNWITKTDLFTIYVSKKSFHKKDRIKYLSKLNNQLDYLDNASQHWTNLIEEKLNAQFNIYLQTYNKHLLELIGFCNRHSVKMRAAEGVGFMREQILFHNAMDSIFSGWQKKENHSDTYVTVDELLQPLRAIAVKEVKNIAALEIVLMIDQCTLWHRNMDTLKKSILENIRYTKTRLVTSKIELNRFLQLSLHNSKEPWKELKKKD